MSEDESTEPNLDPKATLSFLIDELLKQKRSIRVKFTKSKNALLNLYSEEVLDKSQVRSALNAFDKVFEDATEITNSLVDFYRLNDSDKIEKIDEWYEKIQDEYTEVAGPANKILSSTANSKVSSKSSSLSHSSRRSSTLANLQIKESEAKRKYDHLQSELEKQKKESLEKELLLKEQLTKVEKEREYFRREAERTVEEEIELIPNEFQKIITPPQNFVPFSMPQAKPTVPLFDPYRPENYIPKKPIVSKPVYVDNQDMSRNLERLPLRKFYGNKSDYQEWKDLFFACVHEQPWSPKLKMLRLKSCLEGEAKETIKGLDNSEFAYKTAIDRLEKEYGGKRRIIAYHLEAVREAKEIRVDNVKDLKKFTTIIEVAIVALKNHGHQEELGDGMLHHTAKTKIPKGMLAQYKRWLKHNFRDDSLITLRDWLNEEVEILTEAQEDAEGLNKKGERNFRKPENIKTLSTQESPELVKDQEKTRKKQCVFCGNEHHVSNCEKFKSITVTARWVFSKTKGMCYRCLGRGHKGCQCRFTKKCMINGCEETHHPLLHETKREKESKKSELKDQSIQTVTFTDANIVHITEGNYEAFSDVTKTGINSQDISLRTVPVIVSKGDRQFKLTAVLDDCSTASYISERVASELGLIGDATPLNVTVIGGNKKVINSTKVQVNVSDINGHNNKDIEAFTIKQVTGVSDIVNWNNQKREWSHLHDIEFPFLKNRQIDLLIGLNAVDLHRCIEERVGATDEPIARLTPLGWTCVGNIKSYSTVVTKGAYVHFTRTDEIDLNISLKKFWDLDAVGLLPTEYKPNYTPDEREAIQQANNSRKFTGDRYEIGIPWKEKQPEIENNYDTALSRLVSLEKMLTRQPEIAKEYSSILKQHEKKGYIKKVEDENEVEAVKKGGTWYLPHFPVVQRERLTSKVRIVFDASAKHKGKSLNDVINPGPKLGKELFDILIRFRKHPVGLIGDIREMFLQVELIEPDRSYHRFLWRDLKDSSVPNVYEFQRLTFGNRSSPFLAQYVIREHALENKHRYPEAADTIVNSMYMDDVSDSKESTTETINLRRQLTEILETAGFHIQKWCSNDINVINDIPTEDRISQYHIEDRELPIVKTLGMTWQTQGDYFAFATKVPDNVIMTKRGVLSKLCSIFDPLQFISPYTIRARVLMQKTWLSGIGWDETFPNDLQVEWQQWFQQLNDLQILKIPRSLGINCHSDVEFHTFVDASSLAYATVTYSRCTDKDQNVKISLIASKTRVAPLNALSTPRLELLAAVTGLRLTERICKVMKEDIHKTTFWSDSQNVLCWIRQESRNCKPFVAHRLGEIHNLTHPEQWRYIPGRLNPADKATRGMTPIELSVDKVWFNGPEFLSSDKKEEWPENIVYKTTEAEEEMKKYHYSALITTHQKRPWIQCEQFSSWMRLLKVTGWWKRYVSNVRSKVKRLKTNTSPYLTTDELHDAEKFWIRQAQKDDFHVELDELKSKSKVHKSSSLLRLQPQLDEDGILRVNGRLKLARHLPRDAREPMILPRKHHITHLIISYHHCLLNHEAGINHVLSKLSSRFWIIHGRQAVKEVESKCSKCKLRRSKVSPQLMAPLPNSRISIPLRAFSCCGVDYAGPYLTKQGRGKQRAKRYLCLFTCLASRAVHLEMSWSMDTDSFLEAFSRMVNRRGKPVEVISDNGSNLTSGERELRELVTSLDKQKIEKKASEMNIKWKFNPPYAPHFGGVFEAMVKSAKRATKAILGEAEITDEELLTAFTAAENLLNSRPLTYQSDDPKDDVPITPNHFLFGIAGGELAPESIDYKEYNPRRRWYRVQQLIGEFWKRWMRELVPHLNARQKWNTENRDLEVGDIVLCVDTNNPRGQWPLGRIVKIFPGSDGHSRVTHVKIGDKIYTRPISKLCAFH